MPVRPTALPGDAGQTSVEDLPAARQQDLLVRVVPSPERLPWGAILGGALFGFAPLALLIGLGAALGLLSPIADLGASGLAWVAGASFVALFVAGFATARLAGVTSRKRGALYGVLATSTLAAFCAWLLLNTAGCASFTDTALVRPALGPGEPQEAPSPTAPSDPVDAPDGGGAVAPTEGPTGTDAASGQASPTGAVPPGEVPPFAAVPPPVIPPVPPPTLPPDGAGTLPPAPLPPPMPAEISPAAPTDEQLLQPEAPPPPQVGQAPSPDFAPAPLPAPDQAPAPAFGEPAFDPAPLPPAVAWGQAPPAPALEQPFPPRASDQYQASPLPGPEQSTPSSEQAPAPPAQAAPPPAMGRVEAPSGGRERIEVRPRTQDEATTPASVDADGEGQRAGASATRGTGGTTASTGARDLGLAWFVGLLAGLVASALGGALGPGRRGGGRREKATGDAEAEPAVREAPVTAQREPVGAGVAAPTAISAQPAGPPAPPSTRPQGPPAGPGGRDRPWR